MLRQGTIIPYLQGKARKKTMREWATDVDGVWDSMMSTMHTQPGFLGTKTYWNLDDGGEILMLAYWNSMPERLAYERTAARGVRNSMETTLVAVPIRPKYELILGTGGDLDRLKAGVGVRVVAGQARAQDRRGLADRVASTPRVATTVPSGYIGTHVLFSADGSRDVRIMEFWNDSGSMDGSGHPQTLVVEKALNDLLEQPVSFSRYHIVRTT